MTSDRKSQQARLHRQSLNQAQAREPGTRTARSRRRSQSRRHRRLQIASILTALAAFSTVLLVGRNPGQIGLISSGLQTIGGTFTKDLLFSQLTKPVNLLVLGIDNDDNFDHPHLSTKPTSNQAFSNPSDTMLVVRFVPETNHMNVLSIPRDTLVQLPGIPNSKIDWANLVGGAPLAKQVVSEQLENLPIDHYLRVSRNGFIQLIDTLGGVEITIPKKMDYVDQAQHLNIHFMPGRQKLNGRHMEEYVRFRHDELGDIGRVQRQQEVVKELMLNMLNPMTLVRLPQLLNLAQANIDTDLSTEQLVSLLFHALTSDRSKNNFMMLPGRFSTPEEFPRSYWIPNSDALEPILARYFDVNRSSVVASETTHLPGQIKVAVSFEPGQLDLGRRVASLLKQRGFSLTYITDSPRETNSELAQKSKIIAQHGNVEDAEAVSAALGGVPSEVSATGDIWSDVTVVVGPDFKAI